MKTKLILAVLAMLALQGCATGPDIPMETQNQAAARDMCEAMSETARIAAQRRDEGYPKERLLTIAQKNAFPEIAVGIINVAYGSGAKISPQQLKSMTRHSCMNKNYKR